MVPTRYCPTTPLPIPLLVMCHYLLCCRSVNSFSSKNSYFCFYVSLDSLRYFRRPAGRLTGTNAVVLDFCAPEGHRSTSRTVTGSESFVYMLTSLCTIIILQYFRFFIKEFVRNPVRTCRDPISLTLGTQFSLILGTRWYFSLILGTRFEILGTRIGSIKRLKKTLQCWHMLKYGMICIHAKKLKIVSDI